MYRCSVYLIFGVIVVFLVELSAYLFTLEGRQKPARSMKRITSHALPAFTEV